MCSENMNGKIYNRKSQVALRAPESDRKPKIKISSLASNKTAKFLRPTTFEYLEFPQKHRSRPESHQILCYVEKRAEARSDPVAARSKA